MSSGILSPTASPSGYGMTLRGLRALLARKLDSGVVHVDRAQRAAHRADVGAGRFALFLVTPRLVRIHRHRVHAFPVEGLAEARHLVVPQLGGSDTLDQVA